MDNKPEVKVHVNAAHCLQSALLQEQLEKLQSWYQKVETLCKT